MFVGTPTGQTVSYSNAAARKCSNFKAETSALQNAVAYIAEMKPQKTVILRDSKAALQSLISSTPDQPIHQLLKDLQLLPNSCNPCQPPVTRKPKPCSETVENVNEEEPLETTTILQTQSTV